MDEVKAFSSDERPLSYLYSFPTVPADGTEQSTRDKEKSVSGK